MWLWCARLYHLHRVGQHQLCPTKFNEGGFEGGFRLCPLGLVLGESALRLALLDLGGLHSEDRLLLLGLGEAILESHERRTFADGLLLLGKQLGDPAGARRLQEQHPVPGIDVPGANETRRERVGGRQRRIQRHVGPESDQSEHTQRGEPTTRMVTGIVRFMFALFLSVLWHGIGDRQRTVGCFLLCFTTPSSM